MSGLLRAEWLKLRRLRGTWLMLILPCVLAFLGSVPPVMTAADAARRFGGNILDEVASFLFPEPLVLGLRLADSFGSFLIVIFVTAMVGNEFGFDTWKNLLTRFGGRGRIVLAKLAFALAQATLLVTVVPLVYQLGVIFALKAAAGLDVPIQLSPDDAQQLFSDFAVSWLRLVIAASIALLATITARSPGGGIVLAIPWLIADGVVNGLRLVGPPWRDLAPLTFNHNLGALDAHLRGASSSTPLAQAILVLLIYSVGFVALAIWAFRRRDIAG
jgi:ABC-type transport system involved in multi-copper enzyme maturation permease subunit